MLRSTFFVLMLGVCAFAQNGNVLDGLLNGGQVSGQVPASAINPGGCASGYYPNGTYTNGVANCSQIQASQVLNGAVITSGVGAPTGSCTAGTSWYLDTTNQDDWFCSASNTWKKNISTTNSGPYVATGQTSTSTPSAPTSGNVSFFFNSNSVAQTENSSGSISSTEIIPASGATANQFLTYIDNTGTIHTAQLSFGNLSGTAATGQLPSIPLTTGVSGVLPVANGGNGTTSPGLIAGSNVTITGTWPTQTINATGATGSGITAPGTTIVGYIPTWSATNGTSVGAGVAAPASAILGASDTQTLSNKTIAASNAAGTNAITAASEIHIPLAQCTGTTTSALAWNTPPSVTAATASGCSGTSTNDAYAAFASTGTPSLQYSFTLPKTLTGVVDVSLNYLTATAGGTFTPALDISCTATTGTATNDPTYTANNFFAPGTTTAPATANELQTVGLTGLSWPSGCTAGARAHLRLIRTDTTGTATSVNIAEVVLVVRRTL